MNLIVGSSESLRYGREIYLLVTNVFKEDGLTMANGLLVENDDWSVKEVPLIQIGHVIDFDPEEYAPSVEDPFWELFPQPNQKTLSIGL